MVTVQQKEHDFLQILCLFGLQAVEKERTVQSVYYILRGRKAHQTYQDVHAYSLYSLYRLFPQLSVERWTEIVNKLVADGWIRLVTWQGSGQKNTFYVTQTGKQALLCGLEQYSLKQWLSTIDQMQMTSQIRAFWLRLHLLVQTVSHLLCDHLGFIPVVQDRKIQAEMRRLLASPATRERYQQGLHQELFALLSTYPPEQQQLVVSQLSGQHQVGLTLQQIAWQRQEAPSFLHVQMRSILADMCKKLSRHDQQFPLLAPLCKAGMEQEQAAVLSRSTRETWQLLSQGKSIDDIVAIRSIKRSTVEDHLVEIVLSTQDFDVSAYLSKQEQEKILQVQKELHTRRLRHIKDKLGEEYSFLQIRLALAQARLTPSGESSRR